MRRCAQRGQPWQPRDQRTNYGNSYVVLLNFPRSRAADFLAALSYQFKFTSQAHLALPTPSCSSSPSSPLLSPLLLRHYVGPVRLSRRPSHDAFCSAHRSTSHPGRHHCQQSRRLCTSVCATKFCTLDAPSPCVIPASDLQVQHQHLHLHCHHHYTQTHVGTAGETSSRHAKRRQLPLDAHLPRKKGSCVADVRSSAVRAPGALRATEQPERPCQPQTHRINAAVVSEYTLTAATGPPFTLRFSITLFG